MNTRIINRNSTPPEDGWYQIEVTGAHPAGTGRRQVIDETALRAIVNRFADERAADEDHPGLLVDLDHLSHNPDRTTEAYAWLHELDIRKGQLWGRLDLTDLGEAAIRNKRVKFFSTEYNAEDLETLPNGDVRPMRLAGLAFTNRPNNRGGKPISNRTGTTPSGEQPNETKPNQTMKSIAEKLGLSADADEAAILAAIGSLQKRAADAEIKNREAEADAVLNRFGSRVPEAAKPQWRAQLITNRESAEKLMEATLPAAQSTTRVFNRETATAPAPVESGEMSQDEKAEKQSALVSQIRNRDRCSHTQAWDQARREAPGLFN